ncbi:MAG TPA: EF-hand domain-containing protein [Rhizomicrobium sp.]|nr:EF-hand domain-containing protein [Rhizomicrobium sp.]
MTALGVTAVLLAGCGHEKPPPGGYWNPYASPEKPRDENYHGGPEALLLRYDANKDGTLTRAELIAGLKAEFATHDTNHTGCLPEDEVAAINQERVNQDQSTATPLIDWNHDGCLDYSEFSALAYSLFDQMDKNGDGKITPQEFHPNAKPGAQPQLPGEQQRGRGRRGGGGAPPPQ